MNERLQVRALFEAFLARFFENEISDNSRDMKASLLWILAILAAPGLLLPFSNIFRWTALLRAGPAVFQREIIADKVMYLSFSMGAVMLLAVVVWQALLVDRRDVIVLGSFPVRARVIVIAKLAALLGYVGIVGGGMHVVAAVAYGLFLATSLAEVLLGTLGHFLSAALACMFACIAVAAVQAVIMAVAGPRWFGRITAPAQLVLAAAGLMLFLLGPMLGAAAVDYVRGNDRSAWVLWMPPIWFLGVYEAILLLDQRGMAMMAVRAVYAMSAALILLLAAYPLAYRRVAAAALYGSELGRTRSAAGRGIDWLVGRLPLEAGARGTLQFILLTLGRVARHKLIVATSLGAAAALALPFIMRWSGLPGGTVPARSHIAVPFVFAMFGIAGLRMAYNVPSERAAAWLFRTGFRPTHMGTRAARTAGLLAGAFLPALVCLPVFAWRWGADIGLSMALTMLLFGALVTEIGVRSLDFVPFTRAYNPERSRLQARWPLYLLAMVFFLQFVPSMTQLAWRHGNYWTVPLLLGMAAAGLRYVHPPEPAAVVDDDFEDKPLALRLY
jgi:hypothetical protein